jgi:hypothetical protein
VDGHWLLCVKRIQEAAELRGKRCRLAFDLGSLKLALALEPAKGVRVCLVLPVQIPASIGQLSFESVASHARAALFEVTCWGQQLVRDLDAPVFDLGRESVHLVGVEPMHASVVEARVEQHAFEPTNGREALPESDGNLLPRHTAQDSTE